MIDINEILEIGIRGKASDIHLTNKVPPVLRVDGVLNRLTKFPDNTPEILNKYVDEILNEEQKEEYIKNKEVDLSMSYGDVRFRVHIYRQSEADTIALRLIPKTIPTFKEMNLPSTIKKFTTIPNGLILITGVTGSGKSTTLAAMIDEINNNYSKNIITVEDPVEFIHEHKQCLVNQREVGTDVMSFSRAVRAAMREDPDILLVGEMRDLETIQNAITMAETGHLVFATLHTKSVPETIDRIIDVFPPNQQEQVRTQLSNSVKGIVTQELLPKLGGGRVPCCEIMFTNDAIRNLIKENKNTNAIIDQMQTTSKSTGSQTKEQALAKLVVNNLIDMDVAMRSAGPGKIDSLKSMIISLSR